MVPLEISCIVLRSPYLYDRKAIFHLHERKYHFFKDGIEYIIRTHKKRKGLSLIHASEMKRIVNSSQNLTLLMIKQRDILNHTFHKDAIMQNYDLRINKIS